MSASSFTQVQDEIQKHYQQGDFAAALELATQNAPRFPEQKPLLYYWRVCMAARLGQADLALGLLKEVLDSGIWYGEVLLRKSPSLGSLQGLEEFERLVDRNRLEQARGGTQRFPLLILRSQGQCQTGGEPCPILVALHANASTAQDSVDFWKPAANAGWLVGVPQSSQAMWKGSYVWDNLEISRQEVQRGFLSLQNQYEVDLENAVVAGHSMGGEVAIYLALSGAVDVCGFVALGPGGPFSDEANGWGEILETRPPRDLRGYIVLGKEDDNVSHEGIQALVEMLNEAGVPCDLEILPDVGHAFTPEYEAALLRGLEFVTSRE